MVTYLLKRLLLMIPTLLGVALLVFFMLRVLPGDIVEIKLSADGAVVSQQALEAERARLGLDKPLAAQLGDWLVGLTTGDLGRSMWTNRPVYDEIATRLPLTFQVALMATVIAVFVALPMGTLSALYRGSWLDYTLRIVTMAGLAVPSFWLGMLVIMMLLLWFDWLPPLGYKPFWEDPIANISLLIWPALVIGIRYSAVVARMMRSSIIEVMQEDYIRTARAKGLFERVVVARHAMRNAMLPTITVVGLEFAFLLGGLVVTEQVFNLNGIGRLFVQAAANNDFTLIQGIVMLIALIFVMINLLIDVLYALLDPRIRFQ
ncbi:ABC transporter permease [Aquibaculum arenosum]|uniref:ABC transporter permease n=1 Tax=Aquibaculum arenosum TaxID=3032591 RepID=A0ABT5YR17_9PROT|nr:ABC transporter permease [Fodinicurvata sp. CAU 1616]MDF2097334.1 ABC transporter permease [Fodinicurvata sp. CAU 1616]